MKTGEDVIKRAFEENPKEIEEEEASADDGKHDNEAVLGQEGKFKEITNERDAEGACHDGDDGEEESSTEFVEWTRNPIDKDEVNGKGDED